jgi:hypothetical protein
MVAPVLMEAGGAVKSPSELREAFLAVFGVEIEPGEVDDWLKHLAENGAIQRDGAAVALTPPAKALLTKRRDEYRELSAKAREEWRTTLIEIDPSLTDAELDDLAADLDRLVALIVAYHGAEASVILYPEEERSEALRETLRAKTQSLPKRADRLEEVRREGFAQFFSNPSESQRRFLADRLDHGFFATVGTLRPEGAAAIREELAGQRLYLDTNVLIPALGLAGRGINAATRRLLKLTQGLGLHIAVTPWTLDELRHSLKRSQGEITNQGLPARRYAYVLRDAAREVGGVSLAEGFYESYAAHGSSPAEWFRKSAQIEPQLDELGIAVLDDGVPAVEKNDGERVSEYIVLLNREAAFRRGKPRDDPPMQHDAKHRVLIERLRGEGHRQFRSAQYWVLTEDKILPRFGQLSLDGEPEPTVPYCMSSAAWTQIARCFTPRTEDYDQTITDLLASPYLRFGRARNLGEIQETVSRVTTLLADASPTVVAAFISDETLEAVAGSEGQDDQNEVLVRAYERTQDELEERFAAMHGRFESMEEELRRERDKHEGTQAEARGSEEERQALERALAEERERLSQREADLQRERAASADEIDKLKEQLGTDERERTMRREQRKKAAVVAAAILIAIVSIVLRATGVISIAAALLGGGTVIALLVGPRVEHSKWAWTVIFVLAVLAVLLAVLPLAK